MLVTVLRNVQEHNEATADEVRALLARHGVALVNMMGGAGCGKTALLERLLPRLAPQVRCGVLEGDLTTTRDADRIAALGVPVVQLQTEGSCHLDAWLVRDGLAALPLDQLDLVIVENVGNLVCPAEFDIGEHSRIAVLSLMEGDDKPSKYPLLFSRADAVAFSKCDLRRWANFDIAAATRDIRRLNAHADFFETGQDEPGDTALAGWLYEEAAKVRRHDEQAPRWNGSSCGTKGR